MPRRIDEYGVARIGQSRVTLDTVVAAFRLGETAESIVESYPSLRLADVYQDAVDAYVAGREREAGRLREEIEADLNSTGLRAPLPTHRAGSQ